jgi:hypothetical protein
LSTLQITLISSSVSAPPAASENVFAKVNSIIGIESRVATIGVLVIGVMVMAVFVVSSAEIILNSVLRT